MTIEVSEEIGAAHWASYLVNGDDSGLDEREKRLADKWADSLDPAYVVDVKRDESGEAEEPWFSWKYGWHTGDSQSEGGNCLTYITHQTA
ncbi:hypothetical protein vBCbaSRXM_12 [Citromicrobium phage vB_CbaS-RXM]|nr:hypothetical protein vBCbaSRXM_12 [Citromicrobium phage vB_CbaS-RXM]